jgi:hypothetical protein
MIEASPKKGGRNPLVGKRAKEGRLPTLSFRWKVEAHDFTLSKSGRYPGS